MIKVSPVANALSAVPMWRNVLRLVSVLVTSSPPATEQWRKWSVYYLPSSRYTALL